MKFISASPKETKYIASLLADSVKKEAKKRDKATILALEGDLGSGKTTFIKGLAKGFGVSSSISSPTYTIENRYPIDNNFESFIHIDPYRIEESEEVEKLGWHEIIKQPNVIAVEWADKLEDILPDNYISIELTHIDKEENKRKINVTRK